MFLACLGSMVLMFGYTIQTSELVKRPDRGPARPASMGPPVGDHVHLENFVADSLMEAADANHDGHLSAEEAAQLVRAADSSERGFVDVRELSEFLAAREGSRRGRLPAQRPNMSSSP